MHPILVKFHNKKHRYGKPLLMRGEMDGELKNGGGEGEKLQKLRKWDILSNKLEFYRCI